VKKNLLTHKVKKLELDFAFFMVHVPLSCLVHELSDKLGMEHARPSIFSHEEKDVERLARFHEQDKEDAEGELEALRKRNLVQECQQAAAKLQQYEQELLQVALTPGHQGETQNNDE